MLIKGRGIKVSTHISTSKKCPHCGYIYERYSTYTKKMYNHSGCPIKTCIRCGKAFIDYDMKEPALKPAPKMLSVIDCLFTMFSPYGIVAILFAIPLTYDTPPSPFYYLLIIVPAAIWIGSVIYIFRNRSNFNAKILYEYIESEKRLENYEYAVFLKDIGYKVPEKYLAKSRSQFNMQSSSSSYQCGKCGKAGPYDGNCPNCGSSLKRYQH